MATKVGSLVVDMRANTSHFSRGVATAKTEAKALKKTLGGLRSALFALGGALAFKQLVGQINLYTQLSNQLKLVTKDSKELAQVQDVLFNAAQETRGSLEGTVKLYSRLARSTKELNLNQSQLVDLTKLVNKTLVISGASTQESSAAILQLGQGFASGVLRGQELNSVMEQTPRLARAMADGLGVGIGQLREMGKAGKLTTATVVKALQNQTAVIDEEFGKTEKTIAQAMQQIENEFLKTFGSAEGGGLVESLDSFRKVISNPDVAKGLTAIATGIVSVGAAAAGALGYLAQFGTWIGKVAAGGEIRSLDERIAASERQLSRATRELARNDRAARSDSTKKETEEDFQSKLSELTFLYDLKKANEDAALSVEKLKSKKPKGTNYGVGDNSAILEARNFTLEQYANRLTEERKLDKEHLDARNLMVKTYTEGLLRYAEEEAEKKKRLLNEGFSTAANIAGRLSNLAKTEGGKETARSRDLAKVGIGISTAQAIMNGLAVMPFPLGLAMAALAAAEGAKQLSSIGAGGGSSGPSGAIPSAIDLGAQQTSVTNGAVNPSTATQIYFTGDMLGEDLSERLIDIIREATNDRDIVVFNGDSRQAQEIRDTQ